MAGTFGQERSRLLSTPIFYCESGLDLSQDILAKQVGGAVELQNYEPSQQGGYRRIDGFSPVLADEVPGQGEVLHVSTFSRWTLAARATTGDATKFSLYRTTGLSWTSVLTDVDFGTDAQDFDFDRYNWTGADRLVLVSGGSAAPTMLEDATTTINTTTLSDAPVGATTVTSYKSRIFVAGYSTNNGAISFSSPNDETNWDARDGAGEIVVGDEVLKLVGFRDKLIILCRNSIHQLTGSTPADFLLSPITQNIGCVNPKTVQELNGDVLFLAPDGIRTVAATDRIGDFNIASISRPIQELAVEAAVTDYAYSSLIIRSKSQYRLFNIDENILEENSFGIIGGIRLFRNGQEGWEWGRLRGIKPSCADSYYTTTGDILLHGGYDGVVYLHTTGDDFNGASVESIFKTPDIDLNDALVRKNLHKIITYYEAEGPLSLTLDVEYDRLQSGVTQPGSYSYSITATGFTYGTAVYGTSTYGAVFRPFDRLSVQGSGFLCNLRYTANDTNSPHSIQGFAFEFIPEGRR